MTIKEESSMHSLETRVMQNFGWWDISVEEGEPVISKFIRFDKEPFFITNDGNKKILPCISFKPEGCKILDGWTFQRKRGNLLNKSLDFIPPSLLVITTDGNTNNKGKCALAGYILVPFTDGWSSLLRMRVPFMRIILPVVMLQK